MVYFFAGEYCAKSDTLSSTEAPLSEVTLSFTKLREFLHTSGNVSCDSQFNNNNYCFERFRCTNLTFTMKWV